MQKIITFYLDVIKLFSNKFGGDVTTIPK